MNGNFGTWIKPLAHGLTFAILSTTFVAVTGAVHAFVANEIRLKDDIASPNPQHFEMQDKHTHYDTHAHTHTPGARKLGTAGRPGTSVIHR
jgi:hypothetical protein